MREGEAAAFTLSRTGSAAAALMVSVSVEQEGDFISGAKPTTVTFGAGDAAVALEIATVDDEVGEDNGSITVTVTSVPSGTEISQTAASATLEVTDQADTRATISVDQAAVTVKESAGTVTLGFSARMEPNVTPFLFKVSASTVLGTARHREDYEPFTNEVTVAAADFQMESGRLVAHKTLDVTILNNHAGRWEGDETFTIKVERSPSLPATVIFVDQDGDKVSNVTTTITISDDEAPPSLDLSVAPSFVEEGDTATVKVTSANGSAFAEDQTIDLSFSGTAARGADYTVGDDVLTLGAGLTEVTTTVMVLDDSIDDDAGETIVIEAAHAGTSFSQTYTLVIGGLAPPTMLPVTPGDGRVKVCFDEVGATGYTVQWRSASQQFGIRRQKTVFETSETKDCGAGTVSTAIRDLDNGTTYWFRAQSTREWWDDKKGRQSEVSDWSDEVSGTPTAGPTPSANVVLTPGNQQLKVDWDPVADGYSVEWRQDGYFRELDTTTNSATITGLQNGRLYSVRVLAENVSGRSAWSAVARGAPGQPTATFRRVPAAHDGQNAVRFQVGFSHEMGSGEQSLRDDSFTVNDGDVTETRRVDESNTLWEVTVQPDSREEMTILLPGRDCGETGAVCTDEDTPRPLTNSPLATVEGPSAEPLTASFSGVPEEHDGENAFSFRILFSEDIQISYRTLRDDSFTVAGGEVTKAKRVDGRKDLWKITVEPDSYGAVTIRLPQTVGCAATGAICTGDDRPLSHGLSATVAGPVGISVGDARVEEDEGALLAFVVTLSRAASGALTVDYATADGSAQAGVDYTGASGTLSFEAGASSKTIAVAVLDDAHDEGEETLTLTLSNASGAWIQDGVATGTIQNSDPLPRAWLARFGRTVATHVTDAVGERLRGTPGQDSHLTVGGYRLPFGTRAAKADKPAAGAAEPAAGERESALLQGVAGLLGLGSGQAAGTGTDPWGDRPAVDPRLGQSQSVNLDLRRLLLGSSFRLSLGATDDAGSSSPRLTAWGRVAGTTFDGRDGKVSLDGDVLTGTVGVDGAWDRLLAGLAVAHSRGDGSYTMPVAGGDDSGNLEQTLTSIHPYLRYAVNDRLDVWGLFGYGWGDLTMEQGTGTTYETDTTLAMGAFGGRGILLPAGETGGFELATRTDAMLTRTSSDAVAGMASADAEAHRLRLVLEGSRGFAWAEGRRLTPTMEVGLRHDWGDAETGFGLELGGRVQYADPALGLTIEGAVRGLLAHEDDDYEEWGAWGTVRIAPGAAGQGLSLTLAPAWGAASSGVNGLWSRQTTAGLAPQGTRAAPVGRLTAEIGYGVAAPFGTGLLTPYAGTVLSDGAARTYRVGTRLQLSGPGATGLTLNLEGTRQEPAGQQPVNQGLRLQATWGF